MQHTSLQLSLVNGSLPADHTGHAGGDSGVRNCLRVRDCSTLACPKKSFFVQSGLALTFAAQFAAPQQPASIQTQTPNPRACKNQNPIQNKAPAGTGRIQTRPPDLIPSSPGQYPFVPLISFLGTYDNSLGAENDPTVTSTQPYIAHRDSMHFPQCCVVPLLLVLSACDMGAATGVTKCFPWTNITLRDMGYTGRRRPLSASDEANCHGRKRLW